MHRLGLWKRVPVGAEAFLRSRAGKKMRAAYGAGRPQLCLVSSRAIEAVVQSASSGSRLREKIVSLADTVVTRRLEIFGVPVPESGPWPWSKDWRFNKTWALRPYWQHDFYEPRTEPYDAKFPWELSRLAMVVHLLQGQAVADSDVYGLLALDILRDWRRANPIAESIAWTPMEASMRAINLVLLLELAAVAPFTSNRLKNDLIGEFLLLLYCHGVFVWNHIEFTDVRGNHYAANVVALLLIGAVFQPYRKAGRRWLAYGGSRLAKEARLQYLSDGVNFERSVAYHRLVTELFLLGTLAMQRLGRGVDSATHDILRNACRYAAACRRPDGLAVNAGDSDDAKLIDFDGAEPRDHAALISIGAAFFDDENLRKTVPQDSLAVAWLFGHAPSRRNQESPERRSQIDYFEAGGVVTWRQSDDYIWIDVGEVGMNGRGGHGHNDLFSFELILDGAPVIVDPGTYLYTGDLAARDWFRSTAAHNSLQVGEQELADLQGPWRIADQARPFDVAVSEPVGRCVVRGSHTGYRRLPYPATVTRVFDWGGAPWSLTITDRLSCVRQQNTKRRLHLCPGAIVTVNEQSASLLVGAMTYDLTWPAATRASVELGSVSYRYGHRIDAPVLLLEQALEDGESTFVKISKTLGECV
jgi:hypothetical protein